MFFLPPPLPSCCRNYEDLLAQGRTWEQSGEYSRAIDFYLQLTTQNCQDQDLLQDTWEKVGICTVGANSQPHKADLVGGGKHLSFSCIVGANFLLLHRWGKLTTTRSWLSGRRKTPFLLLHHLDITLAYSSANVLRREVCTATIFGYMSAPSFLPSQAVDLSLKFVPERSVDVVALVSDRLANMGRYVQVRSL